jgi:DNA-binding CsgD family transcriptional regulator
MNDTDRLIASLYASAVEEDWQSFRMRALTQVREWLGAVAAAWHTRSPGADGEFTESPQGLGLSTKVLQSAPFDEKGEAQITAELAGSGKRPGVLVSYRHRDGALQSSVALWFGPGKRKHDVETTRRAISHMVEAAAVALAQYIGRDEWLHNLGRSNRGSTALVDASGTFYATSPRFRSLLSERFGDRPLNALPFPMPEEAFEDKGQFSVGELHFRASRAGGLVLLNLRKVLPLDGLSPREQEIARALAEGKTFKSIARQFEIAISTVANHASRIYKKIGVYRREDLVMLMRKRVATKSGAAAKA